MVWFIEQFLKDIKSWHGTFFKKKFIYLVSEAIFILSRFKVHSMRYKTGTKAHKLTHAQLFHLKCVSGISVMRVCALYMIILLFSFYLLSVLWSLRFSKKIKRNENEEKNVVFHHLLSVYDSRWKKPKKRNKIKCKAVSMLNIWW